MARPNPQVKHYHGDGLLVDADQHSTRVVYTLEEWTAPDGELLQIIGSVQTERPLRQDYHIRAYTLFLGREAVLPCMLRPMGAALSYEVVPTGKLRRQA